MANLDLLIDTNACQAVSGFSNSGSATIPLLVQGDTLNMRIWLLARSPTYPVDPPFVYVPNTDITIQVAIGTRVGQGGVLYTQQFTWTPNGDAANPYFFAQLPMNTGNINSLLGSSSSQTAYLEVKYIAAGGVPTTVLSKQVTIQAAVIQSNSVVVPAGLTPLSAEAANALFLKRDFTGPVILRNGTGQAVELYVAADGTFHADPIS